MKLYLVERSGVDWDEYDGFVICCENEEIARNTHPEGVLLKDVDKLRRGSWVSKDEVHKLDVTYLGEACPELEEGVVFTSYNNG